MKLNGLHLLITYQCTFECDHCFVWGSPWQNGTMTFDTIQTILEQAVETRSVEWIYFEGGEPFLYYQLMHAGVEEAANLGFKVGIVTNGYWANSVPDALLWLTPLVGKIQDLTNSSDLFHFSEKVSKQSEYIRQAAGELNIPFGTICIEKPEIEAGSAMGQIPQDSSSIMYRGRAAEELADKTALFPIKNFIDCPHEDLKDPGRIHIDPFGNLHICQGISIGNIWSSTIAEICSNYDPQHHPILGPLVKGGPNALVNDYQLEIGDTFADACHLCYTSRKLLRNRFPKYLLPDQMYRVAK